MIKGAAGTRGYDQGCGLKSAQAWVCLRAATNHEVTMGLAGPSLGRELRAIEL